MRPQRLAVFIILLFAPITLLGGCRTKATASPFDASDPDKAAAQLRRHLEKHPDDDNAWRDLAHIEWIYLGQRTQELATLSRLADEGDATAMLSTMLAAEARMDAPTMQRRAFGLIEQAAASQAGKPETAFLHAAAEVAARTLNKVHGDQPGDDLRFSKFHDTTDLSALPYVVRQPLLSLRAAIARRTGEDYRSFFAEQGCVQAWEATALQGTLGDYELGRLAPKEFVVDTEARVVPLSCVTRVWNPHSRAGVRRLRTAFEVQGNALVLDISGQEALSVALDGKPVYRTDRTDRFPARRYRATIPVAPGNHQVEVATAINTDRAWILVRAAEADGRPARVIAPATPPGSGAKGKPASIETNWLELEAVTLSSKIYAPLRAALAVDGALAVGDSDLAERLQPQLREAEAFAEALVMRAEFERSDPSRAATISAAREQTALEEALALSPDIDGARLRLIELMVARGEDARALDEIEALPKGTLDSVRGDLVRYQIYRSRGNEFMADKTLERASGRDPGNCQVLMAERSQAQERENVAREDELAVALKDCAGSLEIRARLAETRSRFDDAKALWRQVLDRVPDDVDAMEGLARVATIQGDVEAAKSELGSLLQLSPLRVGANVGLADLALLEGDPGRARDQVQKALARLPHADQLHRLGETVGIADDLATFRIDGTEVLRTYQASGQTYEGVVEVLVLDRSVARVYEGGGQRQIVHIIAHLLGKEALDRYGEMDIPSGARLLTLRSIKPDGTIIEPELVPGKDGVSLRHLEVGDFVEYEFVVEEQPASAMPSYVDVSTFRFQSLDVPYHRSELFVVYPAGLKLNIDRRNTPPAEHLETKIIGGTSLEVLSFTADEVPRLGVEPGSRSLLEEVPNVRVFTDLDVDRWLHSLSANVRYATRSNPELRAHVRRLVGKKKDKRAKVYALWRWVTQNIEDGGDLSTAATSTFSARTGNRLVLLRAMLDIAGIESELWLARNKFGPQPLPGGHPMVENYDAAMLAVTFEGTSVPTMVTAASKVMPLGYLVAGYAQSDALRVPLRRGETPAKTEVPASLPRFADSRRWDLDINVDAGGSARVAGTITLQGGEAIVWRQALADIDRDRIEDVFLQAELGWLRGATVTKLEIEGERDLEDPLVLAFEATADALGIVQDRSLLLPSGLVPLNLGSRYVTLPRRVTGLVIPYAPVHEAHVVYTLAGARLTEVPESTNLESPRGRFSRTVTGKKGDNVVSIETTSTLVPGVVEAVDYEKFSVFARKVETLANDPVRASAR